MVNLKKALQYLISLALMALFLYWAFADIDSGDLWRTTLDLPPIWFASIAFTTVLTLALRGWRWVVLMRPFAPQVTLGDAFSALGICYAANIFVPRSGEALRALSLKWKRDAPLGALLGTVLVERLIDMMWLIALVGLSLLVARERITANYPLLENLSILALLGCIGLLLCFALLSIFQHRAVQILSNLLGGVSPRLSAFVVRVLEAFLRGFTALRTPAAYSELLLSSVLLNLGYILIIYQAFWGFGMVSEYALDLGAALVTMAISSLGMIFPTLGGTGTYHFFFRDALNLVYKVPLTPALACATAVHAVATIVYLVIGGPILFVQWRARKQQQGKERDDHTAASPTP